MKIVYDHQIFAWQRAGGISRYFASLQTELRKDKNVNIINTTLISNNLYHHFFRLLPDFYIPGKTQVIKLIDKIWSIRCLKTKKFDIFHPTYYDNYFLNYLGNNPYVITVFDMIHERYPNYFQGDSTHVAKKIAIRNASAIIAISESTKSDLVEFYGLNPDLITVIYLASDLDPLKSTKVDLPPDYILYVGDKGKYKNFDNFKLAFNQVMALYPDLQLVCVGDRGLSLSDRELAYIYSHAKCLVVPSLYEGFGLPVLEAMQCGCPVVCSKTSSLTEIGGSAVKYFDPTSIKDMTKSISAVLASGQIRKSLIKAGYIRARQFSWAKCASDTLAVYRKIYRP